MPKEAMESLIKTIHKTVVKINSSLKKRDGIYLKIIHINYYNSNHKEGSDKNFNITISDICLSTFFFITALSNKFTFIVAPISQCYFEPKQYPATENRTTTSSSTTTNSTMMSKRNMERSIVSEMA